MGEAMGGAVALILHRKKPDFWNGVVLVAPLCKIADDVKPNRLVISVLTKLTYIVPSWKIIPVNNLIDIAFKVPKIRKQIRENKYCYKGRPRLKTGYELLKISMEIKTMLEEVSLPFLVDVAPSKDKTIKLYPGMWHGLLYGETPENIEIVFNDIITWLDEKSNIEINARMERKQKLKNDDEGSMSIHS